jgi:RNA polymerase sigma-70 factor, ECF subfamily
MSARIIPLRAQESRPPKSDIERTFRTWAPYVAGVATRLMGRDQDIEDVVQDVFVEALRTLGTLRDASREKSWLAAVTVRVAMRRLRRRRIARLMGLAETWDPSWLSAPEADPEQRALLQQVYRLLDDFPPNERIAWSLRYLQGEKLEDVAALCGCSLATAKRRIGVVQAVLEEALDG